MGLEEEAVRAALMGMTDLPAGVEGPSLPTPQDLINQGRLTSYSAGGATGYDYPLSGPNGGLPVGAVSDPHAPLGYTIADPTLRDADANARAGLARAVATQNYMDAYQRDRDKNTLAMLTAAGKLDPDSQAALLGRLGVQVNPNQISQRLREQMMLARFNNDLNAPDKELQRTIQMLQARAALSTAESNNDYRRSLTAKSGSDQSIKMLGLLDNFTKAYQIASQPPGLGGNPEMAKLFGGLIRHIGKQFGPEEDNGAAPVSAPASAGGTAAPSNSPATAAPDISQNPWWDQAMPSNATFTPDRNKIAGLLAQLEHVKRFAPGDLGAQMALQRQIQDAMLPPIRQPGQGSSAIRPRVTRVE